MRKKLKNKSKQRRKVQDQSQRTLTVDTMEGVWRAAITSWKLCWVNLSAIRSSSLQEWVSAKARMPRQLEGSSCRFRNSQQASWISASCNKHAAGSSVWTLPSSTVTCGPPQRLILTIYATHKTDHTLCWRVFWSSHLNGRNEDTSKGSYLRGVRKVDEQLHGTFIDIPNDDFRLPALG